MPPFNQLSFGELKNRAQQILLRDSAKLAGTNYSAYPGKTLAPMSALTQRAQSLEQRRLAKGTPYQSGLNSLANAQAQGITPDNINNILGNVEASQGNFNRNILLDKLNRQYGQRLNPYLPKLENKLQQDTGTKLSELGSDIETLNAPIRKLEGKKNRAAFTALNQLSRSKEARERSLVNDLYGYGEQKHGIINKGLTAEKARFEAERNDPYARIQNLQQALNNLGGGESGDLAGHPDLDKLNAQQLTRALQAYGIDTGKPSDQWESAPRTNTPVYQGKLVEPINQKMDRSYKLAEELSPFYRDENYLNRKLTRKDVVNTPNSINRAVEGLPEQLNPKFAALDTEAKRKLKADINALNAKYIKQGTYGSQSHLQAVANRTRELSEATLGARSKATKEDLLKGVTASQYGDINKIGQLGQYDQLANSEFGNKLADIKSTNLKGLDKWKNDQENNEQLYRSYQNERSWQQPRLLNNARNTGVAAGVDSGIGSVFNHFNNQGIDLSSISDLRNKYSELEKELENRDSSIKSAEEYKTRQEELARQNAADFERERNQRMSLEKEAENARMKLQREIEARSNLTNDLTQKQTLIDQLNMLKTNDENKFNKYKNDNEKRIRELEEQLKLSTNPANNNTMLEQAKARGEQQVTNEMSSLKERTLRTELQRREQNQLQSQNRTQEEARVAEQNRRAEEQRVLQTRAQQEEQLRKNQIIETERQTALQRERERQANIEARDIAEQQRLAESRRQEQLRLEAERRVAEEQRQAQRQQEAQRQAALQTRQVEQQRQAALQAQLSQQAQDRLKRLNQYKESAAKRDNLYNSSVVNGVNAFSWSKQNPTHGFRWFLENSLKVPSNTPDNIRIINNLNRNLPLYLEEVKRANYFKDRYNNYK